MDRSETMQNTYIVIEDMHVTSYNNPCQTTTWLTYVSFEIVC